jgi:predicted phage terminase large subunit-like protein
VNGERANQSLYDNTAGGVRISTMMGGRATGKHADILVVDDPHKPDDLNGDVESCKAAVDLAWKRWIETFSNRRADAKTFRRVCIMQRLHEEDIAGRMLKLPNTVHLCLPMEYEPKRHCKTHWGEDWRRADGELLVPARFPQEVVEADRATMTPRAFAAQMQQRPAPEDGLLLLRSYFQNRWTFLPPTLKMYLSVDANLKERKDTDKAVIQCWGAKGSQYWCIDQVDGRWSITDLVRNIKMMKAKWPFVTNILIEDKANGPAAIQLLRGVVPGVIAINPEGGKEARVEAIEWILRAGDVLFPAHNAPWVQALIDEAATFPAGAHDDMVDSMSQFLVWIMTNGKGLNNFLKAMRNARAGHGFR